MVATITIAPVTSLSATSVLNGVQIDGTAPASRLYKNIEIWAADENSLSAAELLATVPQFPYIDTAFSAQRLRYYWARTANFEGRVSSFYPLNSPDTTDVYAYARVQELPLVPDPFLRLGSSQWDFSQGTGIESYVVGAGIDGTDVIRMSPTLLDGGVGIVFTAARRGPREYDPITKSQFVLQVFWRVRLNAYPSASPMPTFTVNIRAEAITSELDESADYTYSSTMAVGTITLTEATTLGEWVSESVYLPIDELAANQSANRYLQVGIATGIGISGGNADGMQIDFDRIDAQLIA